MSFNERVKMKRVLGFLGVAGVLSACVTINIYFPAAAAEKAADKIIDEVWQLQNDAKEPAADTQKK